MVADTPPGQAEQWTRQIARETPVKGRCLWCKIEPEAADPDVEFVPVGDDEQMCSRCRADMREYKRSIHVQYFASSGLAPSVKRILRDAWDNYVQPELARIHGEDHELYEMPWMETDAVTNDDPGLNALEDFKHDGNTTCGGDSNGS